jgi:hypothetical protein
MLTIYYMAIVSRFDVENPILYVVTNILVWTGAASSIQVLLQNGELTTGVTIGVVGGGTYGVANLFFKYRTEK